jgi:hypothetical protein
LPAVEGAVYRPVPEMLPPVADQLTPMFVVPLTLAVNCCVAPVESEAALGETETVTLAGAVTVTVAEADFVLSAALVAVTV